MLKKYEEYFENIQELNEECFNIFFKKYSLLDDAILTKNKNIKVTVVKERLSKIIQKNIVCIKINNKIYYSVKSSNALLKDIDYLLKDIII